MRGKLDSYSALIYSFDNGDGMNLYANNAKEDKARQHHSTVILCGEM